MSKIKIFISHQQKDSSSATYVKSYLELFHDIDCYLDVIDPYLKKGEEIADYVRKELNKCTHLLAVVSHSTKESWWVPWEIGVATEKDYPLASFGHGVELPEFLQKWPYLKNNTDLDKYAEAVKQTYDTSQVNLESHSSNESYSSNSKTSSGNNTKEFYKILRSKLGQ